MNGIKTIAIIQARMNSSRLPGKVLLDIGGQPMLVRVIERARRARSIDGIMIATTSDASDDPLEVLCRERGYPVYRGSQFDVLDRFYQAARLVQADVIVRLTADCPVIDPAVIDQTVAAFHAAGADFAANRLPPPWKRTFPIGLDTEVCSFAGLERAWKEAQLPFEREHVMPYFYNQEGRFKVVVIDHTTDCGPADCGPADCGPANCGPADCGPANCGGYRWTVDTPEDLVLLREIYARFGGSDHFSWLDVLALVQREPELQQINAAVKAKQAMEVDARMAGHNSGSTETRPEDA